MGGEVETDESCCLPHAFILHFASVALTVTGITVLWPMTRVTESVNSVNTQREGKKKEEEEEEERRKRNTVTG